MFPHLKAIPVFDLDQFIVDLRATLPGRSRQALKQVVARAVADPTALRRGLGGPACAGIRVLHSAADLTVLDVVWAANQATLPHNHQMSAVIGMYAGRENNLFWRRTPHAAKYQIEAAGGEALGPGDVTLLGRDVIHSVINPLGKLSAALHIYDGDFLGMARSMWDAETLKEAPYDITTVLKGMAVQ